MAYMTIGPSVADVLGGNPDPPNRVFEIPDALIEAERYFKELIRDLLVQHRGKWVFVSNTGYYEMHESQDQAEIAADKHCKEDQQYVVRYISEGELDD